MSLSRTQSLLSLSLLAFLAACSTVTPDVEQAGEPEQPAQDIALQPLSVPPLSALPETPPRALEGKFVPVGWGALPGWQADDLSLVWKAFINNCKGLMRPVSGSLALPARAAPRAWQPVCAAAQQAGLSDDAGPAQVRSFLEAHLQPWRLADAAGKPAKNTVTGYYEPLIRASRKRAGPYQWPLHAPPADLLTVDLGSVYPELAGKRVRGKLQGN